MKDMLKKEKCYLCGSDDFQLIFEFQEPDSFEKRLDHIGDGFYRNWKCCQTCGLYNSFRSYEDIAAMYKKDYRDSSFETESIEIKARRILDLPEEQSDAALRAKRVKRNCEQVGCELMNWDLQQNKEVLDIGSGLNIFMAKFLDERWKGMAIDADEGACAFSNEKLGIKTLCGYYAPQLIKQQFDLITLINVVEHLEDPIAFLKDCMGNLKDNGILYICVPDSINAQFYGPSEGTFASPHIFLFNPATMVRTIEKAGYIPLKVDRHLSPTKKVSVEILCAKTFGPQQLPKKNKS